MAITSAYETAVASTKYTHISIVEVVLDSGSEFYSTHAVDGLADEKAYLTEDVGQKPSKLSTKRASSSYASINFTLLDKDDEITASIGAESWINKVVKVYSFYEGLTWPTDRVKLFTGRVTSLIAPSTGTTWKITASEERERVSKALMQFTSTLSTDISTAGQTTGIGVNDSTQLQASGVIRINNEFISYTSIVSDILQGVARGANSSTAATHENGDEIFNRVVITGDPITIMLQLLLSILGDGANNATYDVLPNGVGLGSADIDITGFENIRDTNSFGTYTFNIDNGIDDAMRFIETEIQLPTNTRIITTFEGLISLTELGKITFGSVIETITEDDIIGTPQLRIDSREVINELEIQYSYDFLVRKFNRKQIFQDETSIDLHGSSPRNRKKNSFRGITSEGIITSFKNTYFGRNSTPATSVSLKAFQRKRVVNPGSVVEIQSKNLPNLGLGNRVFREQLELLQSKFSKDTVSLVFSSTFVQVGRLAYIAPARPIDSKASETVFDLTSGSGAKFQVGWTVVLWDISTDTLASTFRTITAISTDTITIDTAFDVTLVVDGTHYLRFPDYDEAAESQHLYAFISTSGGGDFNDGTNTYVVQS